MRTGLLLFTVVAVVVGILRRPDVSPKHQPPSTNRSRSRLAVKNADRPSGGRRDVPKGDTFSKGQPRNERSWKEQNIKDFAPKKFHCERGGLGDVAEDDVTLYTSSPDLLVEHVMANVPKASRLWHKLVFGPADARFHPLVERFCRQRSVTDPEKSTHYGYIMPMLAHFPQVLEYYLNRLDRAHNPWRTGFLGDAHLLGEVSAVVLNNPPQVEALTAKLERIAEDPTELPEVRGACHGMLQRIQIWVLSKEPAGSPPLAERP